VFAMLANICSVCQAERIDKLLRSPAVKRDLEHEGDDE